MTILICPPPALTCHAIFPATQSRMRKEFKRGIPSSFCPFRTFRTSEKYLMLHVLLHDQKYQKSSKTFPLRYLPVTSHPAKARTIYTLLCEHIERTVRPQAKAGLQAQMHGLSARLCSVPCRYTAGVPALPKHARRLGSVSAQTSYTPATHFYAGVEPTHTRICSVLSCDVFERVV